MMKHGRSIAIRLPSSSARTWLAIALLAMCACRESPEADIVVDRCIAAHGGKAYDNMQAEFDFRGKHYTIRRSDGHFSYERIFSDSTGQIRDVLNNEGFQRHVDGKPVRLDEKTASRYANSVNSVAYFFLLPLPLRDPATRRYILPPDTVHGVPYHRIRISFVPKGGGEDYEDVFIYWINRRTSTMDYLAYSYETNEGGSRFRKAVNQREVGDLMVSDYHNYKPPPDHPGLEHLAKMYEAGKLKKVSEIKKENIRISAL